MQDFIIRHAENTDLEDLTEIYNHYVINAPTTFDIAPISIQQRADWLAQFKQTGRYQLFVATLDNKVVAYACSGQFKVKQAYETSVEVSVYVANGFQGKRLGKRLYNSLFSSLVIEDVNRAYAGITVPNQGSIVLHERFGFKSVGVYSEVGRKFGQYWDVEWFEKSLSTPKI